MISRLHIPSVNCVPKRIIVFTVLMIFISTLGYSHGSLSLRIQEKTLEISQNPNNPNLYFERGYLYQQHYDYKKAIKDYLKSENLGLTLNELLYRKAEVYKQLAKNKKALKQANSLLQVNSKDVKTHKLIAQIQFNLKNYKEAKTSYDYVLQHMVDIRPEDIMEYTNIVLAIDNTNYYGAIDAINLGLDKLGKNTLTLQLKKLDYLKALNETEKVIDQYNYFILSSNRKEFWYFKKAIYLVKNQKKSDATIALHQSKIAITLLKPKIKNTLAVKKLLTKINELENSLML